MQFLPLAIEDKDSVQAIVATLDKATGFVFKGLQQFDPYPETAYAATAQPVHIPDAAERRSTAASGLFPPVLPGPVLERTPSMRDTQEE